MTLMRKEYISLVCNTCDAPFATTGGDHASLFVDVEELGPWVRESEWTMDDAGHAQCPECLLQAECAEANAAAEAQDKEAT